MNVSRRDFIKIAGLTAGALIIPVPETLFPSMVENQITDYDGKPLEYSILIDNVEQWEVKEFYKFSFIPVGSNLSEFRGTLVERHINGQRVPVPTTLEIEASGVLTLSNRMTLPINVTAGNTVTIMNYE